MRTRYSGRSEIRTPSETPNLNKAPQLRAALKDAFDKGTLVIIAQDAECTSKELKSFAFGQVSKLPDGLRGRTIQALIQRSI
jgi:hypothetical protein